MRKSKQTGIDHAPNIRALIDAQEKKIIFLDQKINGFSNSLKLLEEVLNASLRNDDMNDDRRCKEIFRRLNDLEVSLKKKSAFK